MVSQTDEEDALHAEIDSMISQVEAVEDKYEDWWEKQAARMFNQIAMNVVNTEAAFMLLHRIMCASVHSTGRPQPDPLLATDHVARSLVVLRCATRHMDLDKAVEETHGCIKAFRLLLSPKERRENKDEANGVIRLTTLVAGSPTFREAILNMGVDRTLCLLMKSKLAEIFDEEQARLLLVNARREKRAPSELLHNDNNVDDFRKYLTVIVEGEVLVIRTLDEDEIGRGKCTIDGNFFGAWKALKQPNGLPESEREMPIKEGGSGVNNCVIKAETQCEVILIPIANIREVLLEVDQGKALFFYDKMLEMLAFDIARLDNLNRYVHVRENYVYLPCLFSCV